MMVIGRYVGLSVVRGFLLLALIMVLLFSIILLIDELDQVGTGSYNWWIAIKYVFYHMPKLLLDFAAFISLVGSVIALGSLAANHELVAIESLGVSPRSVTYSVLLTALLLMLGVLLNAQFVIPATLQTAHVEKTLAVEGRGDFISEAGYWAQSNHRFIHIKDVEHGRNPVDVEIFEFNEQYKLQRYLFAKKITFVNEQVWQLEDVEVKEVIDGELKIEKLTDIQWESFLTAEQLGIVVSKPEALSITNLYYFVQGLKQRGEQSYRYELLLWQKIATPFSAAVMILLGIPFVFGSQRHVTTGKRITLGVLAGFSFYVISQVVAHVGSSMLWTPWIIAVLPVSVVLLILLFIQWRVTQRYSA